MDAPLCPPVPLVISIGNIVAGGTGKTPVTLLIAGAFYERFTVAILSRGYRSRAEKLESPFFLSEGEGPVFRPVIAEMNLIYSLRGFLKRLSLLGETEKKPLF